MKKFLLLMVILVGMLCGCAEAEPGTEEVKPPEGEVEEPAPEEDKTFGLSAGEVAYIENWLSSCSLEASWEDLADVDCLGYCRIPTADGERIDYGKKTYALIFKDGKVIQVVIPVEEIT